MSIDGTAGNDSLDGTIGDDVINGFAGNDTLRGNDGNDLIDGGDNDDSLIGGHGFETLLGGSGNDTLIANPTSYEYYPASLGGVFDGGGGVDRLVIRTSEYLYTSYDQFNPSSSFSLLLASFGPPLLTHSLSNIEIVELIGEFGFPSTVFQLELGNTGADFLEGTLGLEFHAYGGDGNDSIEGGALGDSLVGNGGDDSISGGSGVDTISGGAGGDTLSGGGAGDVFLVDVPSDIAGAGDIITDFSIGDYIYFYPANDIFFGAHFIGAAPFSGAGAEYRFENLGGQTIVELDEDGDGSSDGSITIANGAFSLRLADEYYPFLEIAVINSSTQANDTIRGAITGEMFDGLNGNDWLNGGLGDDTLIGGYGDDRLIGGDGDDILTGGAGGDTFRWYTVHQLSAISGAGSDVVTDFHEFDTLDFRPIWNQQDYPSGLFLTWLGTGSFTGFAGEYRYVKSGGQTEVQFDTDGNGVADRFVLISNGEFNLETVGTPHLLRIATLGPTSGADIFAGRDINDTLDGLGGNDQIHARNGHDQVSGGAGDDELYGGEGDDTLDGGADNDAIEGGEGADSLDGGTGADLVSYIGSTSGYKSISRPGAQAAVKQLAIR